MGVSHIPPQIPRLGVSWWQTVPDSAIIEINKKGPVLRGLLSPEFVAGGVFGRTRRIRTADLYHVKAKSTLSVTVKHEYTLKKVFEESEKNESSRDRSK